MNLRTYSLPLLICSLLLLSACGEKMPDCGTLSYSEKDIPGKLNMFYPLKDESTRLCKYSAGDVHFYHGDIPSLDAAVALLKRYQSILTKEGLAVVEDDTYENYPFDPNKDYLKNEWDADFGVNLKYFGDEATISIEMSFLGLFRKQHYVEVTLWDQTPEISTKVWKERLAAARTTANQLSDLCLIPRGGPCNPERIAEMDYQTASLVDFDDLFRFTMLDSNATIRHHDGEAMGFENVTVETIKEMEAEIANGNGQYYIVKKAKEHTDPEILNMGNPNPERRFISGAEFGTLNFVDLKAGRVLCTLPYFAQNQAELEVEYGTPSQVLADDLEKQIELSVRRAILEAGLQVEFK